MEVRCNSYTKTLVALGRIRFFHGQTSLEQKLQSNKKNDRTMKAITAPVIKSIEEARVDELIAGVTHDARHVLVSDNTIYVGYDDDESNATIVGTNVVLKGTTLYTITLIPDVWSHGLISERWTTNQFNWRVTTKCASADVFTR